jgi:phytoene dehydrogenase-like protein
MTPPASVDIVVVGAGLAGLSCAAHLLRSGRSVHIVESSDGVGGRVRSDVVDGFILDRGFQVVLTEYPELHRQLDVTDLDLQLFSPGAAVWLDGKAHIVSDPFREPLTTASTVTAPIGSVLDKARIALLRQRLRRRSSPELLRGEDVTTLVALQNAGFSSKMIDRFFRPLVGGIQLDPTLSASRRMFDIVFKALGSGSAGVPALGMNSISQQLRSQLPPDAVSLSTEVTSVNSDHVILRDGSQITAKSIVIATDGPTASRLLGIPTVASRSVSCVYFAAPTPPVDHKYIILNGEHAGPALNVAVMSNVSPHYAPEGQHLIAAAIPQSLDEHLESQVRDQVRSWWGTQVDQWKHLASYRIPHGQPDQSPPFSPKQRVRLTESLFVCGDHRDTASIQGALFSGRRCAEAIVSTH